MQMSLLSLYILQTSQENTFAGGKKEAWKMTERSHFKFQIQLGIRDELHNYTLITIAGLNNLWFKVGFIEQGVLWDLTLNLLLKASSTQRHSSIIKLIYASQQKDHMAVNQLCIWAQHEVANPTSSPRDNGQQSWRVFNLKNGFVIFSEKKINKTGLNTVTLNWAKFDQFQAVSKIQTQTNVRGTFRIFLYCGFSQLPLS